MKNSPDTSPEQHLTSTASTVEHAHASTSQAQRHATVSNFIPGNVTALWQRAFHGRNIWRYAVWIVLVLLVILLSLSAPNFGTAANISNVLQQASMEGIVAFGMLAMMITGGFDLSVGAVGSSAAITAAYVTSTGAGIVPAILAALLVGVAVGLCNGLIIAKGRINPFMTTFAMASVVSGIQFTVTAAAPIAGDSGWLNTISLGRFYGVPYVFILFLCVGVLTWLLLVKSTYGHYAYSTGGNHRASFLSGVPVVRIEAGVFIFGGLLAAVGGLVMFGQTGIGQPGTAGSWPLDTIAICVIGGASLSGGVGRVQEIFAATLLLTVVSNGLNLLGMSPYIQPAITGAIILGAIAAVRNGERRAAGA